MNDTGRAALVPELTCTDLAASRRFYCALLGFSVRYERPEDGFAYLTLGPAHLMLEQDHPAGWSVGALHRPFGRGINLQIEVQTISPILNRLRAASVPLFREPSTVWYRQGDVELGQTELLVQDPDGYLLRCVQVLGTRPLSPRPATAPSG